MQILLIIFQIKLKIIQVSKMPTIEVKKIEVIPTALTLAVVSAILGFVYGIILLLLGVGSIGALAGIMGMESIIGFAGLGALMIVILPIANFISTFILVALASIIYNFIAEKIGGIKFEA